MDWSKLLRNLGIFVFIVIVALAAKNFVLLKSFTTEWKYRLPIYIQETGGKQYTDVPVLIELNTLALINLGKMRPDCGDIRFYYVDPNTGNETKIPYWIQEGCGTQDTKIWIKVPLIPANSNITIYMYYGNPRALPESNKSAFPNVELVVGDTFREHILQGINYVPALDIHPYYWKDAGRDIFDGYGYTRIYSTPAFRGENYAIVIRPYELGEKYKFQKIAFHDGRDYIIYKDMLPGEGQVTGKNVVLRTVILPASEKAKEQPYSIVRWGDLGYDYLSRLHEFKFTCMGRTYRFYMASDIWTEPRKGKPHVAFFMFCTGADNLEGTPSYTARLRYDDLTEKLVGRGLCVLYIAPTDNALGDDNLKNFFCQEIRYFEQFHGRYFKVEDGIIKAVGITPPETIIIKFGTEERISTEPDVYRGIELQVADTYERGEVATIYAKLDLVNVTPSKVTLEIIDAQGNKVYGPVNMTEIAPYIYSYTFNTSVLEPGTYLIRVLVWLPDNRIFGGVAPIKIQTQFAELRAFIKEEIAKIQEYLQTVVYPKLLEIESKLDNLTQFSYQYLVEIKADLEATYTEVQIIQEEIKNVNQTLYNELVQIRTKTEMLLEKVNRILELIETTVISYLEGISTRIDTVLSDLDYLKGRVDNTIIPKLNIIETYLLNLNDTLNKLNESMQQGFKDISTQIEVVRDMVDRVIMYVDEVEALLRCDVEPNSSVCARLAELRLEVLQIKADVFDIKTTVQNIDVYIRNVLMPKIDEIYYNTQAILANQTKIYNKLVEAYQEILQVGELTNKVYNTLLDVHQDLATKLQEQSAKLIQLNQTVYAILNEIRTVVVPRLTNVENNLTVALSLLETVKAKLDCETNSTVCAQLNAIINELSLLKQDISTIKQDVARLQPIRSDLATLLTRVRDISESIETISKEIEKVGFSTEELKKSFETIQKDIETVYEKLEGRPPTAFAVGAGLTEIDQSLVRIILGMIALVILIYLYTRRT